jgi:hypothetical protein
MVLMDDLPLPTPGPHAILMGMRSAEVRDWDELVRTGALSGSWSRLPASSPLRTVHGSFDPHGSSLYKGIFRHPVSQL